jgi:hypothetical protein
LPNQGDLGASGAKAASGPTFGGVSAGRIWMMTQVGWNRIRISESVCPSGLAGRAAEVIEAAAIVAPAPTTSRREYGDCVLLAIYISTRLSGNNLQRLRTLLFA